MKKVFTLIALALMTLGAWAETKTISPAAEIQFRTAGTEGDVTTEPRHGRAVFRRATRRKSSVPTHRGCGHCRCMT